MKLARFAAALGATAALTAAAVTPAVAQQHSSTSPRDYTCSNQGGGPDHSVICSGLITVNNVLNGTTVNIGDINVLNDTQLSDLEIALVKVADNNINAPVTVQVAALETAVVNTYLTKFGIAVLPIKVNVCAVSVCV
ncbi:preprotein translocase subunit TatB [Streptomyces sp. NPDC051207]|uniref:preprotein translocase subunit TatB n=1 Tax=Streptomyces sp. NPDC051207 TaxID=3154641 RepID=UPI00343086B5